MKSIKYKNQVFANGFVTSVGKLADQPLKSTDAWALANFIKELNEKGKVFGELREKLVRKYAEEKDGQWIVKKGNEQVIEKEFQELVNIEEEYHIANLIKLTDDIKLTAKDLMMIEDILEK